MWVALTVMEEPGVLVVRSVAVARSRRRGLAEAAGGCSVVGRAGGA